MIHYMPGDLFKGFQDDPSEYKMIAHACNCMGTWGPIVAAKFKRLYPQSFVEYQEVCTAGMLPGEVLITSDNVLCLFTSRGYSSQKDPENSIVAATQHSIENMGLLLKPGISYKIHSPLINAGMFRVPWVRTEKSIENGLNYLKAEGFSVDWIVWGV